MLPYGAENRLNSCEISIFNAIALEIIQLRRNTVYSEGIFRDAVEESDITEDTIAEGTVLDVSGRTALVDVQGVNGIIYKRHCSWRTVFDIEDFLTQGSTYRFRIAKIDYARNLLSLSLRFPEDDPWQSEDMPEEGDVVDVRITASVAYGLVGDCPCGAELVIPPEEVSWFDEVITDREEMIGTDRQVLIYRRSDETRELYGSLRRLEENPWPEIQRQYPTGTRMKVTVTGVTPSVVQVVTHENLRGEITKASVERSELGTAEIMRILSVGRDVDVVVTGVSARKRRIRFSLSVEREAR